MKILLIEPFFTGSHQAWAEGYQTYSRHEVKILSLSGKYWKWRMYGGAVTLAEEFRTMDFEPDLILATDMLDLTTFMALCRQAIGDIPTAIYFHENQITYPWSPDDADVALQRNNQYGFLNYTAALAADKVLFNSYFHKESFLSALTPFLKQFPDYLNLENIERIGEKSEVLYLGMDLQRIDAVTSSPKTAEAIILWNHRWEYDKNPEGFFQVLYRLQDAAIPFKLIILGQAYAKTPAIFAEAQKRLQNEIIHCGYADSFTDYARLLRQADILPVTGHQDFFGGSVVEAIYADCYPILPNRLAYPEHIPLALQQNHLYENETDLYQLLVKTVGNIAEIRQNNYKDFVAQYDWSTLVESYDVQSELITRID